MGELYIMNVNSNKEITVSLSVGDRVELYEDVDIDSEEGATMSIIFSDYVSQYVPNTGLLQFEDSDIGRAEFLELVEESDGIEVLSE